MNSCDQFMEETQDQNSSDCPYYQDQPKATLELFHSLSKNALTADSKELVGNIDTDLLQDDINLTKDALLLKREDLAMKHNVDNETYDNELQGAYLDTLDYCFGNLIPSLESKMVDYTENKKAKKSDEEKEGRNCMKTLLGTFS